MRSPPGRLLRPGIVRISPAIGVMKPAPAARRTSRIWTRKPVGRPRSFGLSDRLYCVFAMQIGSPPKPMASYWASWRFAAGW
jgi:hypothetical protein